MKIPDATYCDDGNTTGDDGCSATCAIETGWDCTVGDGSTKTTCVEKCGDGLKMTTDPLKCDVGPLAVNDGCDDTCLVEEGWI